MTDSNRRCYLTTLFGVAFLLFSCAGTAQDNSLSGGTNADNQLHKPYVILISIDGMRWDYPELYPTPAMTRLMSEGVRAKALIPSWPTMTFPNHYSLATGQHPANHGLVDNVFYAPDLDLWYELANRDTVEDARFYGGEPIWLSAEKNGMVAATYFWVGSEAPIQGSRASHWFRYDGKVSAQQKVDQTIEWLQMPEQQRPHLITLYFGQVDGKSHDYGVGSDEFRSALHTVDTALDNLLNGIDALPFADEIYLMVVSDHGQMSYTSDPPLIFDQHIDVEGMNFYNSGSQLKIWLDDYDPAHANAVVSKINAVWQHGTAYTREQAPKNWQMTQNDRFPQIVLQADAGYGVISSAAMQHKIIPGDHGWIPETPQMQGVLIARGKGLKNGSVIPAVPMIDVYPTLMHWLDLPLPDNIDGQRINWQAPAQ